MQCPRCQQDNPPHAKFCLECGTPSKRTSESDLQEASYSELSGALTEALGKQTATSQILRVISASPTDVQPVFDAIARSAVGLCDAIYGQVFQVNGELLDLVAQHNLPADRAQEWQQWFPRPVKNTGGVARVVTTRAVIHLPDVESDNDAGFSPMGHVAC
jgi:hypothetical protein